MSEEAGKPPAFRPGSSHKMIFPAYFDFADLPWPIASAGADIIQMPDRSKEWRQ